MKTAISIPDEVFEAAEQVAKKLGMSRSELYTNAVREFAERYRCDDVTQRLNEVYGGDEVASELDGGLQVLQTLSLEREDW